MNRMAVNGALVLVVAGLAATVYFTQKKEEKGPPLTTLAEDAVTSIRIEHPDQPAIKLEKDGMLWKLTEPVQAPTDLFQVASLVNLATLETRRTLKASEVQLPELKLEPPQFTITLNDQALAFGDIEPFEYRRYVKVGDTVALIDDPSAITVDADYSELVAKEILPGSAEIEKIAVPGLTVTRGEDGKSWTATPASDAATTDALAAFVDAWQRARAMWNAKMPDDGAIGEPITLTLKDGVVELVLVSREPQLVLDRPDLKIRYTLSKADENQLLKLPEPPKEEAKADAAAPAAADAKP